MTATTGPHVLVAGSKTWLAVVKFKFTVAMPTTSTCPFPSKPLTPPPTVLEFVSVQVPEVGS